MADNLLIPYAVDRLTGLPVRAEETARGKAAQALCPNCRWPVLSKQGRVKRAHFAHQQENPQCSPESMLHGAAKQLLAARVNRGDSIKVRYPCDCSSRHLLLFTQRGKRAAVERKLSAACRPDVTVLNGGVPIACVEVVVTHSPDYDPAKLEIPVVTVPVKSSDDLPAIEDGIIPVSGIWGVDLPPCPVKEKERRILAEHRVIKVEAWELLKPMRRLSDKPPHPLIRWDKDKYYSLKPDTARQVHRCAEELLRRGFGQHNRAKPWSFRYRVPGGYIYVLLTSTDIIPIWERPVPLLGSVLWHKPPSGEREDLFRNAIRRLSYYILAEKTDCGCRLSYEDHYSYDIDGLLAPDSYLSEFGS